MPYTHVRKEGKITQDTLLIIDLSHHDPKAKGWTLIVNRDEEPYIVSEEAVLLLEKLSQKSLHTQKEKEKLLNHFKGRRYRYPIFTVNSIFMPLSKEAGTGYEWLNLLKMKAIRGVTTNYGAKNSLVSFEGGQELMLYRRASSLKRSIIQDLIYSYSYYYFYYESLGYARHNSYVLRQLDKVSRLLALTPLEKKKIEAYSFEEMQQYVAYLRVSETLLKNEKWTEEELFRFLYT